MSIEKNKNYIVDIVDNGFSGEGIAKIEDFTIFIQGAVKGERCKIVITKVMSTLAYGRLLEIIIPSESRVNPDCETYKRCGGCDLRHLKYEETLNIKQEIVQSLVNKMLDSKLKVNKTLGMEKPYYYRNKAQYPIGIDQYNKAVSGVFAKRTHTVIPIEKCYIQTELSQEITKTIIEFINKNNITIYNEKTNTGIFRHIIIKTGFKTKQVMCILVLNKREFPQEKELVNILIKKYPEIKTIVKNINIKNTNVILGNENENMYGKGYIEDILGNYTFKISPMSFYQVNPTQVEILYNKAIELATLSKEDLLFDLYCGIGTIGIFASDKVKKVYGIEIVKQAINDAKENAKLNNINNIDFINGDVEYAFDELINDKKNIPSAIIVDPPRKGLDSKTILNILKVKPKKLIYISCNPATMVRDLSKIEKSYIINKIQPVDMFPYTRHVETIAVLNLK